MSQPEAPCSPRPTSTRRFLARGLAFGALAVALLHGVNGAVMALDDDPESRKLTEVFAGSVHPRHLLLGSSVSLWGVDPRPFERRGIGLFNLAFRGCNPTYERKLYEAYRQYQPRPDVVLIEAPWTLFLPTMGRRFENESSHFPPALFWQALFDPATSKGMLLKNRYAGITRAVSHVEALLGDSRPAEQRSRYHQGFAPLVTHVFSDRPVGEGRVVPDPQLVADLTALLARLHDEGTRVVLFQPPQYLPVAATRASQTAPVRRLATQYGAVYLDYNGDRASTFNYDKANYADWSHMTESGSRAFSQRLSRDLAQVLASTH